MNRRVAVALLLLASLAIVAAYCAAARGVEIVPTTDGPVPPWKMLRLDIKGAEVEQLRTAAVHLWPRETAEVQAGYGWDGKPYLLFQGTVAGSYWLSVCVPVAGGLESAEITVEVGGAGPQPVPPQPDPGPTPPPDPGPPLDWLTALSKWVATEAGRVMPGRADEARKWAGAIRKTAQEAAGGKITDWQAFRETMKDRAYAALGYSSAVEWNDRFDDPILTPRIEKEMAARSIATVEDAAVMWSAVADGLDRIVAVVPKSGRVADPISMLIAGGPNCVHCRTTLRAVAPLVADGYRIYYADVTTPKYAHLVARYNVTALPTVVMRVNGRAWQTNVGALEACAVRNWFNEARRYRIGLIRSDPTLTITTDGPSVPLRIAR